MKLKKLSEYSSTIVPARIKEARIARGYSLSDLSELIGVSSQAISKYELGTSKPSPETMMALIRTLDFPMRYFSKPMVIENDCSNSAVFFRARKSTNIKTKEALKIRIKWADEIRRFHEKYIEFPEVDIPDFTDLIKNELTDEIIEEIALSLRQHWGLGLGPLGDIVEILQGKGIIITRAILGNKKVDAFSQWYNNKPYIVLGSDKGSAVRSRFDLAHELGHLIMHTDIEEEQIKSKEISEQMESQADRFAGAFLLPISTFPSEVMSSSINHFIELKRRWKVSVSAMIKRVEQLGYLSENQIRYLKAQMTRNNFWRREPLDDTLESEFPDLFKEAFELLFNNNVVVQQDVLDEISLTAEEIANLCFVPIDILRRKNEVYNLKLRTT